MARRKKPGPRTKSGRLSRAYKSPTLRDPGTPEAQAKRLALVNGSGNQALAFTLPDVLLAHGILTATQHAAAWKLRRARAAVFGVPLANGESGRQPDEERIRRNEKRYAAMLERLSPEQALAVVDLILDLRSPWIRRAVLELPLVEGDDLERQTLLSALDAVAQHDGPARPCPAPHHYSRGSPAGAGDQRRDVRPCRRAHPPLGR